MLHHNKREHNFEEIRARYKKERKANGNKPPVVRFEEVKHLISRPMVPLIKSFYDPYIKDSEIIKQGLAGGKLMKGRLYFRKTKKEKWLAYVKIEEPKGFPMVVKVYGIKLLNRAFHLD